MAVAIDVKDPIELRKAGIRALNTALGYNGALAFINQYLGGIGDYTQDKYNAPDQTIEELSAELFKAEAEFMRC